MYLPKTYRDKSTICTGACRRVESGAEGQGWGKSERGGSWFGKTMQIAPLFGGVED